LKTDNKEAVDSRNVNSLRTVPREERKTEASKPLYLTAMNRSTDVSTQEEEREFLEYTSRELFHNGFNLAR